EDVARDNDRSRQCCRQEPQAQRCGWSRSGASRLSRDAARKELWRERHHRIARFGETADVSSISSHVHLLARFLLGERTGEISKRQGEWASQRLTMQKPRSGAAGLWRFRRVADHFGLRSLNSGVR